MYVDSDRGFGVVAFHFDPADWERLEKKHEGTRIELFAKLLAVSEVTTGEAIPRPNGAVTGAANFMRVLCDIASTVTESMLRQIPPGAPD